jgi:cardiolipin synthase A/B
MDDRKYYKRHLEQSLGIPFTSGNKVSVLKNGNQIFPAMLEAIHDSKERIEFLTFVYWEGAIAVKFAHALAEKAKEGVEVSVILDSFGAASIPSELYELMVNYGVHVEWFRPVTNWKIWKLDNRTHRKVLICDGEIAFTGGVGIAEEWEGDANNEKEWRETHFKIVGPAVFGLQAAFMENWIETGQKLRFVHFKESNPNRVHKTEIQVIRTSASVRWSDIIMLYLSLILMAKESIYITTAYLNPNSTILDSLVEAADRGVNVQIMVPGRHTDVDIARIAGDDCFQELLDAGVQLWYYQKSMLHAKIITIDGIVSCVGSANFNHRSMLKDDEVNVVILDKDVAGLLDEHFMEDLESCEQISEGRWKRRSLLKRTTEKVTNLFSQQI